MDPTSREESVSLHTQHRYGHVRGTQWSRSSWTLPLVLGGHRALPITGTTDDEAL
jgi:hypothetical protein